MIEVFEIGNATTNITPGRFVLLKGRPAFRELTAPCIVLGAQDGTPVVKLKPLVSESIGDSSGPYYSGAVSEKEIHVLRSKIAVVCDTVAEVNALVETSKTAEMILRNAQEAIATIHSESHGQAIPDAAEDVDDIEAIRAFTLLNNSGDSTITWEKDNDEVMRALIEKKMSEGMAFFIIHPKALGFIPRPKSRISDVEEIMKRRSVAVKDEDFAEIIAAGMAGVTERPEIDTERAEQSYDPARIARSQSVGVMPMRGG
ncbi:hypothetical protein [Rhizobium sp. BK176]|uniref:hypothetical protein n=1 Tax=Rhizobium sp. BK176 TaxID=2587071 RepID=UPI00216A8F60|nr:hypothetical protein [Rhizobium sp. BK176]MCS4088702.1 hypothetical protein [Rhizobium sp. BK176]